ncbi:hypothetical protein AGABI2DRAFT_181418 [Agaricus bisporus var. bisporus H97]|uniref:hypothetical protein n=1 Tax=Agaricus bisporus var. bisporus (strain H97 / ATCC MYA-4626 / FGSC 10389) TaxID=936046 RepID=UPI00029F5733|nr:hypothetical protein AGABI2DRAFT_181418 [Agaricus bisporus var. bisporus H97]EKV42194.1 hypothetical protein AGABI2DRAFT_181418 [Agaricus bisporus var. bisporus H97]
MAFFPTCATYVLYLVALLRVLAAKVLGHSKREARRRSTRSRRSTLDKHDLEANITTTSAIELGLNTLGKYEKDTKMTDSDLEFEAFIGQVKLPIDDSRKPAICEDHILPLYHIPSPKSPSVPLLDPLSETQPPPYHQVSLNNPDDVSSRIMEASGFRGYEEPTNGRMIFARGLQFTENNNFQFPASFFSSLRSRSPKSQRRFRMKPKVNQIPANAIPVYLVKRSSMSNTNNNTPRRRSNSNNGTLPTTPTTPGSPNLPLSPFPASNPSGSSLASSCANTPTHEIDMASLPSWRRDPNRAKFIFGSLAKGASTAGVISSSSSSNSSSPSSPTRVGRGNGKKGVVIVESVVGERASQIVAESGFEVGFENVIIGMGLTPPPTPTHAPISAMTPPSSIAAPATVTADTAPPPSPSANTSKLKVESGKKSGRGTSSSRRSRESIMKDVLSWVQNSSLAV